MDYSDTLVVFTNRNDKDFVDANLYMVYSNDLYNRGLYAKAVRCGLLGASAAERIHDDLNLMSCYSVLCCCYQYLGSFDKAIIYADKLYKYDSESGDKDNLSSTLNNLAALYISAQKPRAAEKYILRAIELERQLNHPKTLAIRLGKAADVYIALKQYDKGLKYAT
ncbi:MAG: tetratricopeptide repeat protein, partial [Bacteroidaceae bacterium]|nr:tetratricopeptide repeat protein [Bacteroidaceae bacterium]